MTFVVPPVLLDDAREPLPELCERLAVVDRRPHRPPQIVEQVRLARARHHEAGVVRIAPQIGPSLGSDVCLRPEEPDLLNERERSVPDGACRRPSPDRRIDRPQGIRLGDLTLYEVCVAVARAFRHGWVP